MSDAAAKSHPLPNAMNRHSAYETKNVTGIGTDTENEKNGNESANKNKIENKNENERIGKRKRNDIENEIENENENENETESGEEKKAAYANVANLREGPLLLLFFACRRDTRKLRQAQHLGSVR